MLLRSVLALVLAAALPAQDAAPTRPNVLFAIADDWSAGHASCLGAAWVETPHFDRIADEGLRFDRAFTPNAKCAPSRAAILTGRNSWQLGDAANHQCNFPPQYGGWMEALAAAGFRAGFTGKGWGPGRARTVADQPRPITGVRWSALKTEPPARGIADIDYAANFAAFLDDTDRDPDAPWAFWYGAFEPHRGYEAGSGRAAGKDPALIPRVPSYWPDTPEVRDDMLDYAVEVEHFDRHLGRMLAQLEARGLLDDTLIIVTSDHGMPFPRVKGQAYRAANQVPLAIRFPRALREPGRTSTALVSLIDLAPTILAAAGVDTPHGMQQITGDSLLPLLGGAPDQAHRDALLLGKERHDVGRPGDVGYPIRGIIQGDWLYLHNARPGRWPAGNPETGYLNCDGSPTKTLILERRRAQGTDRYWDLCFGPRPTEELYHLGQDPDCVVDLADLEQYAATRHRLRRDLEARLLAEDDPRARGEGDVFENHPVANPAQRGFYERFLEGDAPRTGWVNASDYESEKLTIPQQRRN